MRVLRDVCSLVIVAIPLAVLLMTWKFLVVNGRALMAAAHANDIVGMSWFAWRGIGYLVVMMLFALFMERISRRVMSPASRRQEDAAMARAKDRIRAERVARMRRPPRRL